MNLELGHWKQNSVARAELLSKKGPKANWKNF